MSELIERVQKHYERTKDLDFIDGSLGLTSPEMRVLASLLVTGGNYAEARKLLPAFDKLTFDRQAVSLHTKGFLGREDSRIVFNETLLRLQFPDELEDRPPDETPQVRVVRRPIRERVLIMVKNGKNPVGGLASVYSELYGGDFGKRTFSTLGKILSALGPERAALLLLEHAHQPMRDPLAELLPMAIARGKGFKKVETAEMVEARRANEQTMADAALQQRLKIYRSYGNNIPEHLREQYDRDMKLKEVLL